MFEDKVADLNRQTTTHPPSYEKRSFDAWLDEKSKSCQVCDDT